MLYRLSDGTYVFQHIRVWQDLSQRKEFLIEKDNCNHRVSSFVCAGKPKRFLRRLLKPILRNATVRATGAVIVGIKCYSLAPCVLFYHHDSHTV